jgi:hypothetical protein
MSRCQMVGGAPLAAPIASSQMCRTPLWDGAFWRITPGALSAVAVQLSLLTGGRA